MERLLNVKEAAALLNVAEMTIRRWTNAGALRCYRVGGKHERRFRIEDLQAYLDQQSDQIPPSSGVVQLGFGSAVIPDRSHLSHLCLSRPEGQDVGISFLLQGLTSEETVLLVAPRGTLDTFINLLETQGVDVEKARRQNRLHLSLGMDTPQAMAAYIAQTISAAHGNFRLFGDMTWVKDQGWSMDTLRELEEMANSALGADGRIFLCQYLLDCFSAQEAMMAAETHDYTFYKGLLRESPYSATN